MEHALEVGIHLLLGRIGRLRPVVQFGLDFFHGEVRAFDEADLDAGAAAGDAVACAHSLSWSCTGHASGR